MVYGIVWMVWIDSCTHRVAA